MFYRKLDFKEYIRCYIKYFGLHLSTFQEFQINFISQNILRGYYFHFIKLFLSFDLR